MTQFVEYNSTLTELSTTDTEGIFIANDFMDFPGTSGE